LVSPFHSAHAINRYDRSCHAVVSDHFGDQIVLSNTSVVRNQNADAPQAPNCVLGCVRNCLPVLNRFVGTKSLGTGRSLGLVPNFWLSPAKFKHRSRENDRQRRTTGTGMAIRVSRT
jgi:hypothetical protein